MALPEALRSMIGQGAFGLGGAPLGNLFRALSDDDAHVRRLAAWFDRRLRVQQRSQVQPQSAEARRPEPLPTCGGCGFLHVDPLY